MSDDNVFMVEDIRCEIISREYHLSIPECHYGIIGEMRINGKAYVYADVYKDSIPVEESKKRFAKVVLLARDRTIRKEIVNV